MVSPRHRRLIVMGGPRAPVAAEPSITVTTDGADATQAVSVISAAGEGDTTTDNFGNSVSVSGGIVSATPTGGWDVDSMISNPATFTNQSAGATDPPSKASGDGEVSGGAGQDAIAEVTAIDFDAATGGAIVISGSDPIAWNVSAEDLNTAISNATSRDLGITGSSGSFEATDNVAGAQTDLSIDSHTLTK